ncbi:flagellar protein FliT [Pseudomonas sp. KNUC1026]|uniref:flagellar protein FliT n=1 Tax=Pseudomonas sp. KNUC1026 TaxID=2893890 RepID=UPI001F419DA1|nr:flagellar protein FliT [Pseudomonas sp. KNUC1026]UFH48006.1 flagellar protein FliT [Pseudomonas sp. KNUC1026]
MSAAYKNEVSSMSAVQKIDATRLALVDALAVQDWQAISTLDIECRAHLELVLSAGPGEQPEVRQSLEALLGVYRHLLDASRQARQDVVEEITQMRQGSNASKVYNLFR